jgi:uncharacterized membrane protein
MGLLLLFVIIAAAVYFGVMMARTTDPETFRRKVTNARQMAGYIVLAITALLFVVSFLPNP